MSLKDRAIYQLPNGRELVACLSCDSEVLLFSLSATEAGLYELNPDGRLLVDGQLTAWQIDDLLETNRVAEPEMTATLAVRSKTDRETARDGDEQSV
jgi:hypothetical protein